MRPLFLHLDDALTRQPRLLNDGAAAGGIELDGRGIGPNLRLWARPSDLRMLETLLDQRLPTEVVPIVAFYGSGDFHHVAAMLIGHAAQRFPEPTTVIHIDNHPDWVRFRAGMHCGSWVGDVARLPSVMRVLTVGPCSSDIADAWRKNADLSLIRSGSVELYPYGADDAAQHSVQKIARPTIKGLGEDAFLALLSTRILTEAVYLTIDKDALRSEDAASNWDQGRLSLDFVLRLIERVGRTRRIVGADICGDWSAPVYGGGALTRARKRIEAWLDQPRTPPPPASLAVNESVNRALLAQFRQAA